MGSLNQGTTSAAFTFLQAGTGAIARSVQSKERDIVSVFDFMTAAQINDVVTRTAALDVTAAIQLALDSLYDATQGCYTGRLYCPRGTYAIGTATQITIRATNGGTRGLEFFGDGRGGGGNAATIFKNVSVTGRDSIHVGDSGGVGCFGINLHDFLILGNDSDGIGVRWQQTFNSAMYRVETQFTGQHGFDFSGGAQQNYFYDLHARRAGYNGGAGRAGIAGFNVTGNVATLHFPLADECNIGIQGNAGTSLSLVEPDTENCIVRGLYLQGAGSNAIITRGYHEQTAGNTDWLFGDGVNIIPYVFITDSASGNSSAIRFNQVQEYCIERHDFGSYNGTESVFIADPAFTNGRIGQIYPRSADTNVANRAVILQHTPSFKDNLPNNLFGTNGSFEVDLTTGWNKRWLGAAGTVANSGVAGLGFDTGTVACKHDVTVATSTYAISPTVFPNLVVGRFYMADFSYTASTNNITFCDIETNGVRHCNYALPAGTFHVRIYFKAQGNITTFNFNITGVCAFTLDDLSLYQGSNGRY